MGLSPCLFRPQSEQSSPHWLPRPNAGATSFKRPRPTSGQKFQVLFKSITQSGEAGCPPQREDNKILRVGGWEKKTQCSQHRKDDVFVLGMQNFRVQLFVRTELRTTIATLTWPEETLQVTRRNCEGLLHSSLWRQSLGLLQKAMLVFMAVQVKSQ